MSVKIQLSQKDIDKAKKFAHQRATACTSLYKQRGGFKYIDVLCGAMGELAVYRWLKSTRKSITKPDFKIYTKDQKSYDCDLRDLRRNYHIKSQTLRSKNRYGASWLLQRTDPIVSDPTERDFLVLTNCNINTGEVEIHGMWRLIDGIEWGECKVESYSKTKVAVYLDDLCI